MGRVILVDDDLEVRRVYRIALERAHHEVIDAADGKEALSLLKKSAVDLVVTDILMPEMDGIETIGELKKVAPDLKIIAMSGGGRLGADYYLDLAAKLGASRVLSKPIRPVELTTAVSEVLADREVPSD